MELDPKGLRAANIAAGFPTVLCVQIEAAVRAYLDATAPCPAPDVVEAAGRLLREANERDKHPLQFDEHVTADMRTVALASLSPQEPSPAKGEGEGGGE